MNSPTTYKPKDLLEEALSIYDIQYRDNPLYRSFVDNMHMSDRQYRKIGEMPFLPISAWKHHTVMTGDWQPEIVYSSSGTGGTQSRHLVRSEASYLDNCRQAFEAVYGPVEDYVFLGLLPSYLDREGSSLITMLQHFVDVSSHSESGFYLRNVEELLATLHKCHAAGKQTVLWGVTYALLDFGDLYDIEDWPDLIIVETGGMKGTRAELPKHELHTILKASYGVGDIHSEYGMTELLSQAYSTGEGVFYPSATMHVHVRELTDPLAICPIGRTGIIHVFDSKNVNTCAFIATQDLGRMRRDGGFEIVGRVDHAEARGCNLLLSEVV
jgi:hypothetical protein